MEYRLRGLPPALWRQVRDKAGPHLQRVLLGLFRAYVDNRVDPLSDLVCHERSLEESGLCCLAQHAVAVAPWTCDCACHSRVETPCNERGEY